MLSLQPWIKPWIKPQGRHGIPWQVLLSIISPVTTTLEPNPIRVKNIFICAELYSVPHPRIINTLSKCTSSHICKRCNLDKTHHIALKLSFTHNLEKCIFSRSTDAVNLTLQISGRNPGFSPALNRRCSWEIILLTSLFLNALITASPYRYVFVFHAGVPTPKHNHLIPYCINIFLLSNVLGLMKNFPPNRPAHSCPESQ